MNVLNALPKSLQDKAKGHLHDIWQAETKAEAGGAFDFFVETYGVKYDKAVAKLVNSPEKPGLRARFQVLSDMSASPAASRRLSPQASATLA